MHTTEIKTNHSNNVLHKNGAGKNSFFQPKLTINDPHDEYEREADNMADKVMRMPINNQHFFTPKPLLISRLQRKCQHCEEEEKLQRKEEYEEEQVLIQTKPIADMPVQRKCAHCEEEEKNMQRKENSSQPGEAGADVSSYINSLSSKGSFLPDGTKDFFEPRFGYDFSDVKIHNDTEAAKSAQSVDSLAYTVGNNIVFNQNQFCPESDNGKKLLAHELTHVVQQEDSNKTLLQRDDIGRRDAPEFGDIELDANCPKGPTQLGKVEPDPPCKVDKSESDDKQWEPFKFCVGSDIFLNPNSPGILKNFARDHPALANFTVHTYASVEGNQKENENLSCHRARRVARELINAGVPPEQIEVVGKGTTTKFGDLQENRRVVIHADLKNVPGLPELDQDAPQEDIISRAISILSSGNYRLAADAYISFWTCGQIPTLRDAVRRIEVTVSKPNAQAGEDVKRLGAALEEKEFNQVILSPETFNTADTLNCVIARIIDMTFHHMVLPHLPNADNFQLRHEGGIFLVELAGFLPCHDPLFAPDPGEPKLLGDPWWTRPDKDPLSEMEPQGCTQSKLPGAQGSDKGHPRLGHKPVQFTLDTSSMKPAGQAKRPINFKIDLASNKAELGFDNTFVTSAIVSINGDPTEFSNYEVGFVRTILSDESTISYVSGFSFNMNSPAPIRDADPNAPVPWPNADSMKSPSPSNNSLKLEMKDSPNPKKIEFLYAIASKDRLPIDPLTEDIINIVSRDIRFGIWLIARRKDSPLDFADIQSLDGTILSVSQIADVVTTDATGETTMKIEEPLASINLARLNGPIPADYHEQAVGAPSSSNLGDKRIVGRELAPDRTKPEANALNKNEYENQLGILADPIRRDMRLTQKMEVNVLLDRRTGRMWVPSKIKNMESILPIQVKPRLEEAEYVPKDILDRFAERLFAEARKELVLEKLTTPSERDKLPFETVTFSLAGLDARPAQFQHMHTRPGIIEEMRELWRLTEHDKLENEWSSTIAFDRQNNRLMIPFERVRGGKLKKTDKGLEARVDICAKNRIPTIHQTILGTIHTHPLFDPVDEEGPSQHDKDVATLTELLGREERFLCGIDHYIVGVEHVFRFNGKGVVEDLGDRRDVLGI
jgi:outer membrane protein OmpA-like peptidoglycan-associated protein